MAPLNTISTLSNESAKVIIAACEAKARSMGLSMNIAVVDASTHLLSFSRMDGAKLTSISIAIDKAFTAAGHRVGTHTYKEAVWPGGPAFGIWNSNGNRFTTIGGGLPILGKKGEVLGAVGCSTGTPAQDQEVAAAGVAAVERFIRSEDGVKARL
ncbi:glc operon protein GlcG [Aulographum hederae CBS 113979]|uniref:Glc operon protein GlcG n=1 Tax=Aulographum hederae CBS 113979 TaxID=1176131 RepID=A0A6G1HEU6_9PEZI|nr:glc operon protein GlcG [Aulographum hederae CBS 113979]